MAFTTIPLANDEVFVEGTDRNNRHGTTVLDGRQWAEITRRKALTEAHEEFDDAVEAFFAPLTEAVERVEQAHRIELDPLFHIVEQEAEEGSRGQREILTTLTPDSAILRAIETGQTDRLMWHGDRLVITAQQAPPAAPASPGVVMHGPAYGQQG